MEKGLSERSGSLENHNLPLRLTSAGASFPVARIALLGAGAYGLVGLLWIALSSEIAASMASSVSHMALIETAKGYLFVLVTSLTLFGVLLAFGNRVRAQQDQIARQMETLARSERAVLAGTFASTIAHDINNALTVAVGAAGEVEGQEVSESLTEAHEAIAALSRRLLDLGARFRDEEKAFEVVRQLRNFLKVAVKQPVIRNRRLEEHYCEPVWICGDRNVLARAILNMVLNAAEATERGGRIGVSLEREGDRLMIHVDDDGPGLPEGRSEDLFTAFSSTKPDGHGLGLMSVVACAQLYRGQAEAGESPLGGARFSMILPIHDLGDLRSAL